MKFLLPLFSLAFLLSACSFTPTADSGSQKIALVGPDDEAISVIVEIADDPEERSQGLMNRAILPPDQGMLFMFQAAEPLTFWMKNTLIPLDIIFFDGQGNVIGSDSMVPCTEDPCLRYTSSGPAVIALEVNAGFVAEHRIGQGWRIALPVLQ
jgi:uncharacterized membrane protein (UPF0127 family)